MGYVDKICHLPASDTLDTISDGSSEYTDIADFYKYFIAKTLVIGIVIHNTCHESDRHDLEDDARDGHREGYSLIMLQMEREDAGDDIHRACEVLRRELLREDVREDGERYKERKDKHGKYL